MFGPRRLLHLRLLQPARPVRRLRYQQLQQLAGHCQWRRNRLERGRLQTRTTACQPPLLTQPPPQPLPPPQPQPLQQPHRRHREESYLKCPLVHLRLRLMSCFQHPWQPSLLGRPSWATQLQSGRLPQHRRSHHLAGQHRHHHLVGQHRQCNLPPRRRHQGPPRRRHCHRHRQLLLRRHAQRLVCSCRRLARQRQ